MVERPSGSGDRPRTSVSEHRATRALEGGQANPAWINEALVPCRKDVELARSAAAAVTDKDAVVAVKLAEHTVAAVIAWWAKRSPKRR